MKVDIWVEILWKKSYLIHVNSSQALESYCAGIDHDELLLKIYPIFLRPCESENANKGILSLVELV